MTKAAKIAVSTPQPAGDAVLLAVTGPKRGTEFPLPRDRPEPIDGRFTVAWTDGVYVVRSMTDKEIMVGGEVVAESILNPGDVIITETGEYRFVSAAQSRRLRTNTWRAGLAALAVVVVAILLWPIVFPRIPVQRAGADASPITKTASLLHEPVRARGAAPDAEPPIDRIAHARLRYALAEDYERQSGHHIGLLFWAIQEWKQIERDVGDIVPPPDVLVRARQRIAATEKVLEARKVGLRNAATIAYLGGQLASADTALQELLSVTQNPTDPAYLWAVTRLHQVRATEAQATSGK